MLHVSVMYSLRKFLNVGCSLIEASMKILSSLARSSHSVLRSSSFKRRPPLVLEVVYCALNAVLWYSDCVFVRGVKSVREECWVRMFEEREKKL